MKKTVIWIILIVLFLLMSYFLYYFNVIPHKQYTNKDFNIEIYTSKTDKDQDGIDDQTDILHNVREYIQRKPKYKI